MFLFSNPQLSEISQKGLVELSMLFERLHLLFGRGTWSEEIGAVYESEKKAIIIALKSAGPSDWYRLRQIFMSLDHANATCSAEILQSWNPAEAAISLALADPIYYDSVTWFLSGPNEHSSEWCKAVGQQLDWKILSGSLKNLEKGNVDSVFRLYRVLQIIKYPLKRSQLRQMSEITKSVLEGASLNNISMQPYSLPLLLQTYKGDLKFILEGLNGKKLSEELSKSVPKYWRKIGEIGYIASVAGTSLTVEVIENLGESFVENVNCYANSFHYELRVLLWFLGNGGDAKKVELAKSLYPIVLKVCRADSSEKLDILKAYANLSLDQSQKICEELGVNLPEVPEPLSGESINLIEPERCEELHKVEVSGRDYVIGEFVSWY